MFIQLAGLPDPCWNVNRIGRLPVWFINETIDEIIKHRKQQANIAAVPIAKIALMLAKEGAEFSSFLTYKDEDRNDTGVSKETAKIFFRLLAQGRIPPTVAGTMGVVFDDMRRMANG